MLWLLTLFVAASGLVPRDARTWNDNLGWISLEQYQTMDRTKNDKPYMFQVHLNKCGACQFVKKELSKETDDTLKIEELSSKFIMVLIEKDELKGTKMADRLDVDGQYFPRTFFASRDGQIYKEVINSDKKDTTKHQYFMQAKQIAESMEKVLELEASRIEPTEELSEEDAAKAARRQARAKGIRRTVVKDKARGFNDKIDWKLIDDVERIDLETDKKPLLLLQHMKGCQACQHLAQEFNEDSRVNPALPVFDKFHMVNILDDEDFPSKWEPEDAGYFPRVIFVTPDGTLLDVKNEFMTQHPWFYPGVVPVQYAAEKVLYLLEHDLDMDSLKNFVFSDESRLPAKMRKNPDAEPAVMIDPDDDYDDDAIDEAVAQKAAKKVEDDAKVEL